MFMGTEKFLPLVWVPPGFQRFSDPWLDAIPDAPASKMLLISATAWFREIRARVHFEYSES